MPLRSDCVRSFGSGSEAITPAIRLLIASGIEEPAAFSISRGVVKVVVILYLSEERFSVGLLRLSPSLFQRCRMCEGSPRFLVCDYFRRKRKTPVSPHGVSGNVH